MTTTRCFLAIMALILAPLLLGPAQAAPAAEEIALVQGGGGMRGGGGGRRMSMEDRQKEMQKQFDEMITYLGLDEKQEKEARALFKERNDKMKELFEQLRDGKLDRMAMRDSMREIGADYREKFDQLLTEEQRKKQEQWSSEHARFGGGDRMGGNDSN